MEVYTHRGIGFGEEQTYKALTAAARLGLQHEVDVRGTLDEEELVLMHDRRLDRTTNGMGNVDETRFAVIKGLRTPQNQEIPTVDGYLEEYRDIVDVTDFDIKQENLGPAVLAKVKRHGLLEKVIFTSFHRGVISSILETDDRATVGYLSDDRPSQGMLARLASKGVKYVCPNSDVITPQFVEQSNALGLSVAGWVDGAKPDNLTVVEYGIQAVIVNDHRLFTSPSMERAKARV